MTPDRIDANPDENAEHGILDESGNLDTASITILNGHIAQVSVDLPPVSDDDDLDDDVVEHEVPLDDTDLLPLAAPERGDHPAGELVHEPHVEQLPTGDIILEPHPEDSADDSGGAAADGDVHDAEIVHDAAHDAAEPEAGIDEPSDEAPSEHAQLDEAEVHDAAEPAPGVDDVAIVDDAALYEADAADPADLEVDPAAAPESAAGGSDAGAQASGDAAAEHPHELGGAHDSHGAVVDPDDEAAHADHEDATGEDAVPPATAPPASEITADDSVVVQASPDDEGTEPLTHAPWVPAGTQGARAGDVDPLTAAERADAGVPADVPSVSDDTAEPARVDDAASAPVAPATGAIPATRAERAATGVIGTVPLTRRSAQQADEAARAGRAHALERVTTPAPEVSLTSKRLGEIDDSRESADLLTADRLLDPRQIAKPEPEGLWQQLVYSASGRRINLGDGRRARERKDLDRRIATPLAGGARFVPVLSRKGGVGKTTVTSLLGMALADARDDRIIAVDANPDRGTLADRVGSANGRTVRDLVRAHDAMAGYNDVSSIVARDATRLDVLASDADPRVSEAFSDDDYRQVADVAAHYYSIVLTDTGTGIVHSVMGATLELADTLVIVAGLSVDEARLASETLTWLETNGYAARVRDAVVVLNNSRPGVPLVKESELEAHFRSRVRTVIRMPYDARIAAGSAITFRELQPGTRQAARELAAAVVEGLRTPVAAA